MRPAASTLVTLWAGVAVLELIAAALCVYSTLYGWAAIDALLMLYAMSRADKARRESQGGPKC